MSTKRFLGYDTDETGKLVINRTQEPIVIRLYQEFLDGKTTDYIKRIFEREGVKNWDGGTKWQSTTLMSMLENEKYKGDALLQKSYTVDFLTKKRTQNKGEIQMFYVEDDHDAIISKRIWECVQLEIKRRKKYLEEHGTNSYSHRPESNPFASKIICGDCNKVFARKGWRSSTGVDRKVWQCSERYKVKGVMGCVNRHVEEETLIKAYLMAWNALVENREDFMEQWTEQLQSENVGMGEQKEYQIGVWGQRYKRHLKSNHRVIYYNYLTSGRLYEHLAEVDTRAEVMFHELVKTLAEKENVTEKLKAENTLLWIRKMNNIRNRATEIVNVEVIYV